MHTLEETVYLFPSILIGHSKILFEILDALIRDKNTTISHFAGSAYRIIFGIGNCDRKVVLSKLIGCVYERRAAVDITTNALSILTEISQTYPTEMKQNSLQVIASDSQVVNFRISRRSVSN